MEQTFLEKLKRVKPGDLLHMIYRGASANQLKPVRMIDNPLKERFFFALLEE